MTDENGHQLGPDLAMYFTPHSMRPFLISASVALGAPKDGLKWLQGWNAKGGESYIRTCGVETTRIQDVVAHAVRAATATEDPLGEALELQNLAGYLVGRGVHELEVERVVKALSCFPKNGTCQRSWNEWEEGMLAKSRQPMGDTPTPSQAGDKAPMSTDPTIPIPFLAANAVALPMQGQCLEEHEGTSRAVKFGAPIGVPSGYVISISGKKQFRRLHFFGGCHRLPGVDYIDFEDRGHTLPSVHEYDDYCHQCWSDRHLQSIGDDFVGTESESSSTASEDVLGVQYVRA